MKAIITKYFGPGDRRGSRIMARAEGVSSLTSPYDHALNADENHAVAARALAERHGWKGSYHGGCLPDGRTRCWVSGPVGFVVGSGDG